MNLYEWNACFCCFNLLIFYFLSLLVWMRKQQHFVIWMSAKIWLNWNLWDAFIIFVLASWLDGCEIVRESGGLVVRAKSCDDSGLHLAGEVVNVQMENVMFSVYKRTRASQMFCSGHSWCALNRDRGKTEAAHRYSTSQNIWINKINKA